jgi:DNA-binding XRE family transcriptional regulator
MVRGIICLESTQSEVKLVNFELLKARKEADFTQQGMESETGIKRQRYNRIELEKTKPTIDEAYIIAKVVNKKLEEIFLPGNVQIIRKNQTSEKNLKKTA